LKCPAQALGQWIISIVCSSFSAAIAACVMGNYFRSELSAQSV
jgi:hypothetical protein